MNIGIIAEYNPFHNGHLYHMNKCFEILKYDGCIVVMSGNFVQRGEPALINKWQRTKMALLNGADIVIELPVYYSSAAADIFAFGAVDILNKTGIIDYLCFGAENENINAIKSISEILLNETEEFKSALNIELKKGASYPQARLTALSTVLNQNIDFLKSPNNILALEYVNAIFRTDSKIKPFSIKRKQVQYHSLKIDNAIASATAIRKYIIESENNIEAIKKCVPENCFEILKSEIKKGMPSINDYSDILHYLLLTLSPQTINGILDITEGLENRILKYASVSSIIELIEAVKTKRYTYTKIQRAILHILLNITKKDINNTLSLGGVPYIRILGFRKQNSGLLKQLIKNSTVPVITNIKKDNEKLMPIAKKLLETEIFASNLYCMSFKNEINMEYTQPLVII